MAACPACGVELEDTATECPSCHLTVALFPAVKEAAGSSDDADPAYLRTIGELLAAVDPAQPTAPVARPARGLLSRPMRYPALAADELPRSQAPAGPTGPVLALTDLPPLPSTVTAAELVRRVDQYLQTGRRLGLNVTDFEARANAARLVDDRPSLEVLAREMFVHLSSALAEEYESLLARRNEIAQLVPAKAADVELAAARKAIESGDLIGTQRRLTHVRDEIGRVVEEWEIGRILVAECELLAQTVRELGGDPTPAIGPLEEGRRLLAQGQRISGERLLASAAVALWAVLEPRLLTDLHRIHDRLKASRSSGTEVTPGLEEFKSIAIELRQRNFAGTILAYRRLRLLVDRTAPLVEEGMTAPPVSSTLHAAPPA